MTDNNNIYPCLFPNYSPRTSYDRGCRCSRCKYCRQKYSQKRWQEVLKPRYHANKTFYRNKSNKWRIKNIEKVRKYFREYTKKQRQNNPLFCIKENLRTRLNKFIKKENKSKSFKIKLGCSYEELKVHLETQFTKTMSWNNYGKVWSIDHKIPLASATNKEDIEKLNHFTNLQPLLIEENLKKGKKLIP